MINISKSSSVDTCGVKMLVIFKKSLPLIFVLGTIIIILYYKSATGVIKFHDDAVCQYLADPTVWNHFVSKQQKAEASSEIRFIYNRVPKCGSTTVNRIMNKLSQKGRFHTYHSRIFNKFKVDSEEKSRICSKIKYTDLPMMFERHVYHFDMIEACGFSSQPIWINVLRHPIDRYVSLFHFLKNGARTFKAVVNWHLENVTIDDCARSHGCPIRPNDVMHFFCGQGPECDNPAEALPIAKKKLVEDYLLVGLNEDLEGFFQMLEFSLPTYFKGAREIYLENMKQLHSLSSTKGKEQPLESTVAILQEKMKYDIEFYEFARSYYFKLKCSMLQLYQNSYR